MTLMATMPNVETPTDRQRLVGWVVRDAIVNEGITFTDAARRWPMALPTLNRLMATGNVGLRFYRVAERNLGLPQRLLDYIADGNVEAIRGLAGMNEDLRSMILRELGGGAAPPNSGSRKRRA